MTSPSPVITTNLLRRLIQLCQNPRQCLQIDTPKRCNIHNGTSGPNAKQYSMLIPKLGRSELLFSFSLRRCPTEPTIIVGEITKKQKQNKEHGRN